MLNKTPLQLFSITFVGVFFGRALRYLTNVALGQFLGPASLGIFATGLVIVKSGSVVGRLGLDNAGQKYIPRYVESGDDGRVAGVVIISIVLTFATGTIIALAVYFGFSLSGVSVFGSQTLLLIFSVSIPIYAVMSVGMAATRGFKETKYAVFIRDIGQSTTGILLVLLGAILFNSIEVAMFGYFLSLIVGSVLALLFLYKLLIKYASLSPSFEIRNILSYTLPLLFVAVVNQLMSWIDILMLNILQSSTVVGKYQAAFQTAAILGVVLQTANSLFPTLASDLYDSGQKGKLQASYLATTKWMAYLSTLGFLLLGLFPHDFLSIFGQQFLNAKEALVILGGGQVIFVTLGLAGPVLIMSGYERVELVNTSATSVINMILNYFLIQQYGIKGAAIATVVSMILLVLLRTVEVWWYLGLVPVSFRFYKGLIAIAATIPALAVLREMTMAPLVRVVIAGIVAASIFGTCIWILGFDETDKVLLESV